MKKSPGFWFFTGDWLKDPELRFCSIFARGLLIDLLCYMFEAKEQGYMTWSDGTPRTDLEIVDAIVGGTTEEKLFALKELERKGVLSRDSRNALYSRRMSKLKELSEIRKNSGSKGGSKSAAKRQQKKQQTDKQKGGVTDTVSVPDTVSVSASDLLNPPVVPQFDEIDLPKEIDNPQMRDAWRMWCKHCKEIEHPLTETQAIAQLKEFAKVGVIKAVQGIQYTVSRGWRGIRYPEESEQLPAPPRQKTQEEKDAQLAQIRAQRAMEDAKRGA